MNWYDDPKFRWTDTCYYPGRLLGDTCRECQIYEKCRCGKKAKA